MQFETWLKTDMQEPLKVVELDTSLFGRDVNANIIGVEITDGGEPVTLTGDVHGYVIRSTGTTVPLNGTLSGNRAQIVLNESCYLDPGSISIAIKIGSTTVAACHGYVYRTETDTVVDPEHVIPSINEIIEQIRLCEQATAAANTAAGAANTAAGTANTSADDATLKASRAQSAANAANYAANRLNNLTVSAQEGSTANAQVSDVDNHKHIAFTLPVGATPDISVAVTTRSPGTGATIDVDKESPHSPEAPLITFGIPEGQPGQVTNVNGESIAISPSDSTNIKAYIDGKNGANIPISSTDSTDVKAYVDAADTSLADKCKNLVTHKTYTLTNCQAGQYYNQTAEAVAGYRFMCWLQPASQGFVACGMYGGSPWATTNVFWCEIAGTYQVTALYISTGE